MGTDVIRTTNEMNKQYFNLKVNFCINARYFRPETFSALYLKTSLDWRYREENARLEIRSRKCLRKTKSKARLKIEQKKSSEVGND